MAKRRTRSRASLLTERPRSAKAGARRIEGLRRRAEAALEARAGLTSPASQSRSMAHELEVHQVELEMQNEELSRLNHELESARDRYRALYDTAPIGYITTDRVGGIVEANQLSGTILGLPPERLVGRRFHEFLSPAAQTTYRHHCRLVNESREGHACELSLERADGREVNVHLESARHDVDSAKIGQIKTVLIDVTGSRRLERQLLEGQRELAHVLRVQTLGELAPALAHEFSQPLQAIRAYASAGVIEVGRAGRKADPALKIVKAIAAQAERATSVLTRVRRFVRKAPPELAPTDVNALIREVVQFVAGMAKERQVSVEVVLDRRKPRLTVDEIGIQQLLLNLILNGFDAMTETPRARRVLTIRSSVKAGRGVQIAVMDRGRGLGRLGPAHLDRIFGSYYSTKSGGLGLGLAICRRIAELHGGELSAEARPGSGATFRLTLPIPDTAA